MRGPIILCYRRSFGVGALARPAKPAWSSALSTWHPSPPAAHRVAFHVPSTSHRHPPPSRSSPTPASIGSSFLQLRPLLGTPRGRAALAGRERRAGQAARAVRGMATSDAAREPPALPLAPIPSPSKVKIALCQLAVTSDKAKNIEHARDVIEKAADNGAKLILLPEMWNCPYSNDSFPIFAEELQGPAFDASPSAQMLSKVAKAKQVTIVGGSIPERREGRLFNTSLVFGSDGSFQGKFSKLHLFDIDIPGKMTFKESLTLTPGDDLLVADTEVGRIGVSICYDIRFPELAMLYAARGVHILCYPGAFNLTTGPLHWELLQRARATDNQVFVATCSPARDDSASYRAWGHSTVVGPFGEVLATTGHEEATVIAEIDLAEIPEKRQSLPFGTQRRGDLYTLLDKSRG